RPARRSPRPAGAARAARRGDRPSGPLRPDHRRGGAAGPAARAPRPAVWARARERRAHHAERRAAHRAALAGGPADAYTVSLAVYGDRLGPNARRIAGVEAVPPPAPPGAPGRAGGA